MGNDHQYGDYWDEEQPPEPLPTTPIDDLAGYAGELTDLISEEGRCHRCNRPIDDHTGIFGYSSSESRPMRLYCPKP